MRTILKFLTDAGYYGGGSVLLAIILLGVTLVEHARGRSVQSFWFYILIVVFFCIGSAIAWHKEYKVAQKYLDEQPRLGLHIVSQFGRKEWQDQADSKNTPVWFSVEHLGGRIPTNVRFDPIRSQKGSWTLCFGSEPYVKPPVRSMLSYEIRENGQPINSGTVNKLGWGIFLMHFVCDREPQPEQDEFMLIARYMDGDAERTQTFKLVFDSTRFGFLPNTMH